MTDYSKSLRSNMYHAIYIEYAARNYPLAQTILENNPETPIVFVRHYKDVFNRPHQNQFWQKDHPFLILAVKEAPFLYEGPKICQNFGNTAFFYTSFLLNCPFDCKYCYLQGMYPSAGQVAFVNTDDFVSAISELAQTYTSETSPSAGISLAASYDTDLLAFKDAALYIRVLEAIAENYPQIHIEIRTKSAKAVFFHTHTPRKNLIYAFSLAPDAVIRKNEKRTPSLAARIRLIRTAMDYGYPIRLCFDPVFIGPEFDALYENFYTEVFACLDPEKIIDVSHGFFRMNETFFRRIARARQDTNIYSEDYLHQDGIVTYSDMAQERIRNEHIRILAQFIPKEKIFI